MIYERDEIYNIVVLEYHGQMHTIVFFKDGEWFCSCGHPKYWWEMALI